VEVRSLADGKAEFSAAIGAKPPANVSITARVFFSSDGKQLFAVNAEHLVVWEWRTGRKILDYDAYASHAANLDRQVAVNYRNKSVSTAREEHYADLLGADLSRDGQELISCSKDEVTLFNWNAKDSAFHARKLPPLPSGRLMSGCGYFPQNRYFLTLFDPATNLSLSTTFVDRKTGDRKDVTGEIDASFPVPASGLWLVRAGNDVALLNEAGEVFNTPAAPISSMHPSFTRSNAMLLWRPAQDHPLAWDLSTGEADLLRTFNILGYSLTPSGDGTHLAFEEKSDRAFKTHIAVADTLNGNVVARFPEEVVSSMYEPSLNGDGSVVAMLASDARLEVYSVTDSKLIFSLALAKGDVRSLHTALNPEGNVLAVSTPAKVSVYELPSGKNVVNFPYSPDNGIAFDVMAQFSPDGAWLALARQGDALRLVSTKNWTDEKKLAKVFESPFAFSPDSKRIAYPEYGVNAEPENIISFNLPGVRLVMDDIDSGKHLGAIPAAQFSNLTGPAFSADGKILAVDTGVGLQLVNADNGQLMATLYVFSGESTYDWLVVTPNGLFDGTPAAWRRVNWRFNGDTFDVAPVESFFREFYHPGLLAEVIAGKPPAAAADIARIDRRQPVVTIAAKAGDDAVAQNHVPLSLTVVESREKTGATQPGSGARDLRLFRDGTLVKIWRGEIRLDKSGAAHYEADVPITAGDNKFTAYAFNDANIKSSDASLHVTGADALQRKGTAYVLSIGINRYAADKHERPLNLNYAEADATDFAGSFSRSQHRLDEFGDVKTVSLLNEDATRANIAAALGVLGGKLNPLTDAQRTLLGPFAAVRPEDGVFVFYAGHGEALGDHFYLLPTDFQPDVPLTENRSASISETALSELLEDISPARSFLVIDACNSGKALDTNGVALGPMNSIGLAQVAYEKGLDILAASQTLESALETSQLGHGYLTYALVEEGLKTPDAAQDSVVELRPWFAYAGRRVPELQIALINGTSLSGRGMHRPGAAGANGSQHPRMFYRREPEATPFIVAKPPANPPTNP
jgi:WD40 repeat protein